MDVLRTVKVTTASALAVAVVSCAPDSPTPEASSSESPSLAVYSQPTTSPDIAERNLNASVDSARTGWERGVVGAEQRLNEWLSLRVQVLGTMQDLDETLAVAEALVEREGDADAYLQMADVLASLHRFDEAYVALDEAEMQGADVAEARGAVDVALGAAFDGALDARLQAAEAYSSFANHTAAASALATAGMYEQADEQFIAALDVYRDVSPYPVAWVQFQRGVLWGEAVGNDAFAEALYRDAVRLVPGYVVANVHLAELEAGSGDVDAAIARLQSVTDSGDPEPWSRLAQYLSPIDPQASAQAADEADRRYGALLDTHLLAFADHAAEFYLGAGEDAERGYDLAMLNLENRKTDRAYELAIGAAVDTGRDAEACAILEEAGPDRARIGLVEFREDLACSSPAN